MAVAEVAAERPSGRRLAAGVWFQALRRLLRKKLALGAVVVIVAFYTVGTFADLLAPYDEEAIQLELSTVYQGPSWAHPFGTDSLGRDMLSRVLFAARTTIIITGATVLSGGIVIGVGLGLLAGYRRGLADTFIMRLGEVFSGIPPLLFLILLTSTLRPRYEEWARDFASWSGQGWVVDTGFSELLLIFAALSLFFWVGSARLIRSQVLALREAEFVQAARVMGSGTGRILWSHILPNIMPLIIVGLSASLGAIAGTEIALAWLGIGVQDPVPSFGKMIFEGGSVRTLQAHPHLLLVPASIVALLMYSFNLLGDALNDVLNPRRR